MIKLEITDNLLIKAELDNGMNLNPRPVNLARNSMLRQSSITAEED